MPTISQPEHDILESLNRYYFLTAEQVKRLHYSPTALSFAQANLKKLADKGLAKRDYVLLRDRRNKLPDADPKKPIRPKFSYVYWISQIGQRYLASLRIEVDRRFNPKDEEVHGNPHLVHILAINDFLISAALLPRSTPEIKVVSQAPERALKRKVAKVAVRVEGKEETVPVISDGWIDFQVGPEGQGIQFCIALELDRGTEGRRDFSGRVRARIAWSQGPYQKAFGTQSLTIAYVVPGIPGRLQEIKQWTEEALQELGLHFAPLFLFTDLDPATTDPRQLFLEPTWVHPFGQEKVALLVP